MSPSTQVLRSPVRPRNSWRPLSCIAPEIMAYQDLVQRIDSILMEKKRVRHAHITLPFEDMKDFENLKTAILKRYRLMTIFIGGSSTLIGSSIMTVYIMDHFERRFPDVYGRNPFSTSSKAIIRDSTFSRQEPNLGHRAITC